MRILDRIAALLVLANLACRARADGSSSEAAAAASLQRPFTSSFAKLDHAPCVTLFTRKGRIGCGTHDRSIQLGKLQYFDGSLSRTNGQAYVVVMEEWMLTASTIDTLVGNDLLKGVLVLNSTNAEDANDHTYYSPEVPAPNGYGTAAVQTNYGYYTYKWNAKGQGLFEYDLFGMPMAFVKDADVSDTLRQEAKSSDQHNSIVAEFNYYMGPDGITSMDCLDWKDQATDRWVPKCLPLGGTSVWASAGTPAGRNAQRASFVLATSMDAASFFHDVTPGANTAASNILTLLMAAKLIGQSLNDDAVDMLAKRIVFGFFQGEAYGFIGSRAFLRDVAYPGFACDDEAVRSVSKRSNSEYGCLSPLRPSLAFANLNKAGIAGMISVDQIGHSVSDAQLYVHADQNNDQYGTFLANVLKACSTSSVTVSASSTSSGDSGYPYPPTPLTSLLSLSGGAVGGAVLTGYDYAFTNSPPYHSHRDSADYFKISLKSIAAAATISARAAVAAAYDGGDYDYETGAAYAANLIGELSYEDDDLVALADCLLYNGDCSLLQQYAQLDLSNDRDKTGFGLVIGENLGKQPSYYVGVYNGISGQPFVQVGDQVYGSYAGSSYGKSKSDAIGVQPRQLERAIRGLLDDYLGRQSARAVNNGLQSCKKLADCDSANYCGTSDYDTAVCTAGGQCVCQRAFFHVAVDEAVVPAANMPTGYFELDDNDQGISALYTEPYWSNTVGVRVYRDVGSLPGFLALAAGIGVGAVSLFSAFVLKVGLKKEKLY